MITIRTAEKADVAKLLDIYNYEVLNGVATFDLQPKTLEERMVWFEEHNINNHPLIVAELDGEVTGYASLSPYRTKEAYASTVELSVYVDVNFRGRGVATALMKAIIKMARDDERTHMVVSVITHGNEASDKLHKKFGFDFSGTLHEVGVKFGRYLDIDNFELRV